MFDRSTVFFELVFFVLVFAILAITIGFLLLGWKGVGLGLLLTLLLILFWAFPKIDKLLDDPDD